MDKLKEGFTTGACAAAAAKIAALNLINSNTIFETDVWFPDDRYFHFKALWVKKGKNFIEVAVKKFAGDDPDITNGAIIGAKVSFIEEGDIIVKGGKGVGKVTKKGLAVSPGMPAINPVPMKMIRKNLKEVLEHQSVEVEIFVIDGEKLAFKTLNKKLGIVGGISILGTTGIVKPISVEAYIASIEVELNVAKANGVKEIVFVTGRTSEKIAKKYFNNFKEEAFITIGDHIGISLKKAVQLNFKKINIVGQFGKFTKIASGEFQTHVKYSTIFIKNLNNFLSKNEKYDKEFINIINTSISARYVFEVAIEKSYIELLNKVVEKVAKNCFDFINCKIPVSAFLAGYKEGIFAKSECY